MLEAFDQLRYGGSSDASECAGGILHAGHALVGWYRTLSRPLPGPGLLRVRGLDPNACYAVSVWPDGDEWVVRANTLERGGDELMRQGLFLDDRAKESPLRGDFQGWIFELRRVSA